MFLLNAIIFGIVLIMLDKVASKISKRQSVILGTIDHFLDKISGRNILVKLFIVLAIPIIAFYLTLHFSDDTPWYWLSVGVEVTFLGYIGASFFRW